MNKLLKRILLGVLIWAIPFIASFFFWDISANAPSVSQSWFNALMAMYWSLGYAIAVCIYFNKKDKNNNIHKDAIITGFTWYFTALLLDLIFLVTIFGMALKDFYPMIFTYLNVVIITIAIGYILNHRK